MLFLLNGKFFVKKLSQAGLRWLNHKKIIMNSSPFEYTLNVWFFFPFFK